MTITSAENLTNGDGKAREPLGPRCEFKAYREVIQPDGQSSVKVIEDPFEDQTGRDDDSPYAIVVRQIIEPNKPEKKKLRVNSPHILQAFRDVIQSYSMVPSGFKSPVELESPFKMPAHHWTGLEEYRHSVQDTPAGSHIDLLFDFMRHEMAPAREKAAHMVENNQISYENAWVPFQPGDLLYSEVGGHPWLLLCEKTAYEEDKDLGPYFEVQCTYSDHNDTFPGRSTKLFQMFQKKYFPADNPAVITYLPVYPLSFAKPKEGLQDRLRERSERFLSLVDRSTATYTRAADFLKGPPYGWLTRPRASGAGCGFSIPRRAGSCSTARLSREEHAKAKPPCGWAKRTRCCVRRRLRGTPYPRSDGANSETAAEGTKKALIMTSVGELNKNNYTASFERELKRILQYATTGKAIVLLYEADELEYFSGIAFLTTNRVESFDTAMKSRIHLSLGYHPPEHEVRRRIWALGGALKQLVASELNGREISNAVNTAHTIARFEEKRLQWEHIRTVLEVRSAFDVRVQSEAAVQTTVSK
ncbi:hypothetical protein PG994_013903 [Apiospora phragmitis]|uniref:DUF7025 domain-containing protein n=1 Tax=Apiospora phragmitis TaxID=2905665 RepID=A0ABR1T4B5_9PEZI